MAWVLSPMGRVPNHGQVEKRGQVINRSLWMKSWVPQAKSQKSPNIASFETLVTHLPDWPYLCFL